MLAFKSSRSTTSLSSVVLREVDEVDTQIRMNGDLDVDVGQEQNIHDSSLPNSLWNDPLMFERPGKLDPTYQETPSLKRVKMQWKSLPDQGATDNDRVQNRLRFRQRLLVGRSSQSAEMEQPQGAASSLNVVRCPTAEPDRWASYHHLPVLGGPLHQPEDEVDEAHEYNTIPLAAESGTERDEAEPLNASEFYSELPLLEVSFDEERNYAPDDPEISLMISDL
mmetsp:Transcript_122576/g.212679  ORF Transcript_122576/g.212679 Transcript_122576/m.212679 type:complete len:223 (-) Transcript_122576:52-720(-)